MAMAGSCVRLKVTPLYLLWGEKPSLASTLGIGVIVVAGLALLAVAGRSRPQDLRV
jgi:hypothetical protein